MQKMMDPAYQDHVFRRGKQWLANFCTCQTTDDGQKVYGCRNDKCDRLAQACGGYCGPCFALTMSRVNPQIIDADHLCHQREWSERTFGPGRRTLGVTDHIRKELLEIESDPDDWREWVDVIILAFDGAWRAGADPQEIIDAIKSKQGINEARDWPDWKTQDADHAIEHVR